MAPGESGGVGAGSGSLGGGRRIGAFEPPALCFAEGGCSGLELRLAFVVARLLQGPEVERGPRSGQARGRRFGSVGCPVLVPCAGLGHGLLRGPRHGLARHLWPAGLGGGLGLARRGGGPLRRAEEGFVGPGVVVVVRSTARHVPNGIFLVHGPGWRCAARSHGLRRLGGLALVASTHDVLGQVGDVAKGRSPGGASEAGRRRVGHVAEVSRRLVALVERPRADVFRAARTRRLRRERGCQRGKTSRAWGLAGQDGSGGRTQHTRPCMVGGCLVAAWPLRIMADPAGKRACEAAGPRGTSRWVESRYHKKPGGSRSCESASCVRGPARGRTGEGTGAPKAKKARQGTCEALQVGCGGAALSRSVAAREGAGEEGPALAGGERAWWLRAYQAHRL